LHIFLSSISVATTSQLPMFQLVKWIKSWKRGRIHRRHGDLISLCSLFKKEKKTTNSVLGTIILSWPGWGWYLFKTKTIKFIIWVSNM
jgi:hypothetical protein